MCMHYCSYNLKLLVYVDNMAIDKVKWNCALKTSTFIGTLGKTKTEWIFYSKILYIMVAELKYLLSFHSWAWLEIFRSVDLEK